MDVVRFKFSADLLCDVVATYLNFSRLVKLCQKLFNLCHFVNVALEKVCFPNLKSAKMFVHLSMSFIFSSLLLWGSASRFFAAKLRASVAVESFLCAFIA